MMATPRVLPFEARHLSDVLALCESQGWPSLPGDPARAQTMLTAPGAATVVALDDDTVVGFAFAIVDAGCCDVYLSTMAVDEAHRRRGIARLLVRELFLRTGAARIDLLAQPGSEPFYDSLPHRSFNGYRLYPESN